MAKKTPRAGLRELPTRQTTAALTLVSQDQGTVVVDVNGKTAPGAEFVDGLIEWGDEEVEQIVFPLPQLVTHAYAVAGRHLMIVTLRDSAGTVISPALTLAVELEDRPIIPPQPEPAALDMVPPPEQGQLLSEYAWQYQQVSMPMFTVKT